MCKASRIITQNSTFKPRWSLNICTSTATQQTPSTHEEYMISSKTSKQNLNGDCIYNCYYQTLSSSTLVIPCLHMSLGLLARCRQSCHTLSLIGFPPVTMTKCVTLMHSAYALTCCILVRTTLVKENVFLSAVR